MTALDGQCVRAADSLAAIPVPLPHARRFWESVSSPSIVPNDRLNRDFYLVLGHFRNGAAFRATDEGITCVSLIDDLLTGQYGDVLDRVSTRSIRRTGEA